mmetsp:Transcript_24693/g.49106  ORF Transcript_24693/g.49106 Transcript_24693/m.49106 type:complete len:883 (-) Transcript_24693:20-2668(-)
MKTRGSNGSEHILFLDKSGHAPQQCNLDYNNNKSGRRHFLRFALLLASVALLAGVGGMALLLPSHPKTAPSQESNDDVPETLSSQRFSCPPPSPGQLCLPTPTLQYCNYCLSNPFVSLSIDPSTGRISSMRACLTGDCKQDPKDALAGGIGLESKSDLPSPSVTVSDSGSPDTGWTVTVASAFGVVAKDSVEITLLLDARSFAISTSTTSGEEGVTLYRSFSFAASSATGFYVGGPTQMKDGDLEVTSYKTGNPNNGQTTTFFSEQSLLKMYALGPKNGELPRSDVLTYALNASAEVEILEEEGTVGTLLISSGTTGYTSEMAESGLVHIYAGTFNGTLKDTWTSPSDLAAPTSPPASPVTSTFNLAASDFDLPPLAVPASYSPGTHIPADDLRAFLTGIYASPVGCICTHVNCVVPGSALGQIGTSIQRPDRGYSDNYNFFDPDNYISTSALLFSMDPYLQAEVKKILLRNGDLMLPSGQLPHHFSYDQPQYQALSGEIQTGPNVFWVLSCFQYAKTTGDVDWLQSYMPTLRNATNFLYDLFKDPTKSLVQVPGSLMVDVFKRWDFTSDTNAMLVGFFQEFADAEESAGNVTGAESLRKLSDDVKGDLRKYLWDAEDDDHFITQLSADGTTRDFVDYDSNLMALAHGVVDADEAASVFKRIDGGRCRAGVTFVAEDYYGPQDTTGGNTGDSWCAMGRHAWFDSLSRFRYGDKASFDDLIYGPLQGQLLENTWMHERLGCDGQQQLNRTSMYFEYPSLVAMLTMRVRYGIQLKLDGVEVDPKFAPSAGAFIWEFGTLKIEHSRERVSITLPRGLGPDDTRDGQTVVIAGLEPGGSYAVSNGCEGDGLEDVKTDQEGRLERGGTTLGLKCRLVLALKKQLRGA